MTDEEQLSKQQSRRARRRAEQAAGEADAEESPAESADAHSEEADGTEAAETSATDAIREDNRRARRAAAARRRAKRSKGTERQIDVGLGTGEMVDDALARSADTLTKWTRRHFNVLQWVIVLGVGGWIGWEIYSWRTAKAIATASDALMEGVHAEQGRLGTPTDDTERGSSDNREVFETSEARLEEAAKSYQTAMKIGPESNTAVLAKLGLAGVRYDQGKLGEAIQLYESVAGSALAKETPDVKGRALEGTALALEAQKKTDLALKKYQELENAELPGFGDLARYHRARLLHASGDDGKAKELLVKILEKESKSGSPTEPPSYLEQSARGLLERIDPKAVPKDSPDEALKKALEEFQKNLPEGANVPVIPTQLPQPAPPTP